MNVVLIIPAGVGAKIGGHAGISIDMLRTGRRLQSVTRGLNG